MHRTAAALGGRLFRHGVASGDPLQDRVILWTRVTPPASGARPASIEVRWQVASDERLTQVVARGAAPAAAERDFTVKVDAGRSAAGAHLLLRASTPAASSRLLAAPGRCPPTASIALRLASVSCSNYPAGYFNVYRCLANRSDLDAVLHLGDYIYEFANGVLRRRHGHRAACRCRPAKPSRSPITAGATPPIAATSICRRRIAVHPVHRRLGRPRDRG